MKKSDKKNQTLNELRQTKDSVYKHPEKWEQSEKRLVSETHSLASEISGEIFLHLVEYHLDKTKYVESEEDFNTSTKLGVELFDALENIIEHELLKLPRALSRKWANAEKVLHQGKWYVKY